MGEVKVDIFGTVYEWEIWEEKWCWCKWDKEHIHMTPCSSEVQSLLTRIVTIQQENERFKKQVLELHKVGVNTFEEMSAKLKMCMDRHVEKESEE